MNNPAEWVNLQGDETTRVQDLIIQQLKCFTVALFGVFEPPNKNLLQLAGSGSLVTVGGAHYILTAAHVWEERLRSSRGLGLTLKDYIDHRFVIPTEAVVPFGTAKPERWGEWGPDLTFLRIPPSHVGSIKAKGLSFYDLVKNRIDPVAPELLETWVIMGSPAAYGEFTEIHAELMIVAFLFGAWDCNTRDGFDYLDFRVNTALEVPGTFGGLSGGGLWRVLFSRAPSTGKLCLFRYRLEGVVFWETEPSDGQMILRCHGPQSVRLVTLETEIQ